MFATFVLVLGQMWDGDHMGPGWWWVMGIGWLIFLALIVVLAVVLVRGFTKGPRGGALTTSSRSASPEERSTKTSTVADGARCAAEGPALWASECRRKSGEDAHCYARTPRVSPTSRGCCCRPLKRLPCTPAGGTTHARRGVDARHVSKLNVPAPTARLAEEVRLVDVKHCNQRVGTAGWARLEGPPAVCGIAQFSRATAELVHR